MMKNKYLILFLLFTVFSISSCIQEDVDNTNSDIISIIPTNHVFSFENASLNSGGDYYTWQEYIDDIPLNWWANGNPGYQIVAGKKKATEYPTSSDNEGFSGKCVKLTTCDTGSLGKLSKKPIAAGSIFLGKFDNSNAMKAPLETTQFGLQIAPGKPIALTGYYKYTPGEKFTNKNKKVVENRRDTCAIYSVLFEVNPHDIEHLDGSNITSSDRIVLIAEMENPGEPSEWTQFSIPFISKNNKEFDFNKLKNKEYAITIVASSSKDGAFFEGAIGSTLLVDEIKVEWELEPLNIEE